MLQYFVWNYITAVNLGSIDIFALLGSSLMSKVCLSIYLALQSCLSTEFYIFFMKTLHIFC